MPGQEGVRTGGGLFFNIDFVFRTSMRPFFSIFPLTTLMTSGFVLTTTPESYNLEVRIK